MTAILARLAPAAWLRTPRPTARLRLTMLYGVLFLISGATLLTITYLLFEQATGAMTLPGGGQIVFGDLPRNPAGPIGRLGAAGTSLSKFTAAQVAQLQAQLVQLHSFETHELLVRSGIALAITVVTSIALGWLVAGRVLAPVRAISVTARQIGASNLDERLGIDGPDDEFRELAATLDDLLERLEAAFDSQRRFVANASHELRTPLTLDRALLERALRHSEPTQAFWRATCERLLASNHQQDRLIEALLTLARSEGGVTSYESFELSTAIDSVLLSPEFGIGNIGLHDETESGQTPISGDPRLVERLVRNLVDNAIRYNEPCGRVDITTKTQSDHVVLVVSNTGPGVSAADINRIFQPFQRLAPNRSGQGDGIGLGLSIVKAIADAHDATITAIPQPRGGMRMEVSFPLASVYTGQHHRTGESSPSQPDQPSGRVAARPPHHRVIA